METKNKTLKAVDMKRRGAEIIFRQTAALTPEQELAFWQQRTGALLRRQAKVKQRRVGRGQSQK